MPERVAVVTGASSGIGRAAAAELARRGYAVVLSARRAGLVAEAAAELEARGARALAVPADVTDEAAVVELARRAVEAFGRIDVWVSNAGVYQLGRFEETPADVFRRIVETNFLGGVESARAALPVFRRQGSGVLVFVASVSAHFGPAYSSAYAASKWALRGFAASLRAELAGSGISVAAVSPASIDTPLFRHTPNYAGRVAKPLPPVYDAERVARAIADAAERPRPERIVGPFGKLLALQRPLAPALTDRIAALYVERLHFRREPAQPTAGNAFEPVDEVGSVDGGYGGRRKAAIRRAALAAAAAGAAPLAVTAAWRRRS